WRARAAVELGKHAQSEPGALSVGAVAGVSARVHDLRDGAECVPGLGWLARRVRSEGDALRGGPRSLSARQAPPGNLLQQRVVRQIDLHWRDRHEPGGNGVQVRAWLTGAARRPAAN